MNKSKLREQIAGILAEVCYNFDSDDYYINIDEVKEDEGYKETLIKLEKLFDENRKDILEEVRREVIGEDESWFSMTGYTRNDFRRTLKEKLSLLEGNK